MGKFEEAVLLTVARLRGEGYGVTIRCDLSERLKRDVSFGAVYATLERLEAKGYISSRFGEATPERGGKAKRHYRLETSGARALSVARAQSDSLWAGLPGRSLA
jgi:PadR family transcriptional regulator, regulatory protein PadR